MKYWDAWHKIVWNGKNANGYLIPSGIYVAQAQTSKDKKKLARIVIQR
jgi:hypothetical protein